MSVFPPFPCEFSRELQGIQMWAKQEVRKAQGAPQMCLCARMRCKVASQAAAATAAAASAAATVAVGVDAGARFT